jgi:23S rRNA pseudouridine1911/1915/1917 synthase
MADRLEVKAAGPLLAALAARFSNWSRNTLKQRLRLGCVLVNGHTVSRHDHPLAAGDVVEVVAKGLGETSRERVPMPPVLFDDDDLIAIDKPVGMLSVATDEQREGHALAIVRAALSRPGHPVPLWPVHRLDRETSGVLLFARSREACDAVQAAWASTEKTYLAVVEGHPDPAEGVIDAPLWEDDNLRVRVGEHEGCRPARTHYRTQRTTRGRALLEVRLDTGRKHQIRAHLAHLGHAIVGDARYGRRDARLGLHSLRLVLPHPRDGRQVVVVASPPAELLALLGSP